jgi:hypothetical protein
MLRIAPHRFATRHRPDPEETLEEKLEEQLEEKLRNKQ